MCCIWIRVSQLRCIAFIAVCNCTNVLDSIIFLVEPGDTIAASGTLLGQLKDELGGSFIVKFVCSGPKSYSYVTEDGQKVTKVKGLSIRSDLKDFIDFEILKAITLSGIDDDNVELKDLIPLLYDKLDDESLVERLKGLTSGRDAIHRCP